MPGKSGEEKTTQPENTRQPARLVALQEKLAVEFDDKLFDDTNSAQYRALEWLALEDPMQLDLDSTPFQTLKNRYIIVLLYYSTNGQNCKNQYSFLSNTSVCVWNKKHEMAPIDAVVDEGVHCDPTDEEVTVVQFINNTLDGRFPSELAQLSRLSGINLPDNRLVGTVPHEIGDLESLRLFSVRNSDMNGLLPPALFGLRNLERVYVEENAFSGTLSTSIGYARSLYHLYLEGNKFSGSLPTELGLVTTLEELRTYLGGTPTNILTGTIPSELGMCTKLTFLHIGGARLTGTIPTEIGRLQELGGLSFHDNFLTGTVPSSIASLPTLNQLVLSDNDLVGNLDPFFCNRTSPIISFGADCLGPQEEIVCSCCTLCCDVSQCQGSL